jgi:hypothetical protein
MGRPLEIGREHLRRERTIAASLLFHGVADLATGRSRRQAPRIPQSQRHAGATCIVGHFKRKYRNCNSCGATWIGHEEKETDVAISTKLVADAFRNRFDQALIISADSDLAPAIKCVQAHFPNKAVNVIAPPGRRAHARDLNPIYQITPGRIAGCLLPETTLDPSGKEAFRRPPEYRPPRP